MWLLKLNLELISQVVFLFMFENVMCSSGKSSQNCPKFKSALYLSIIATTTHTIDNSQFKKQSSRDRLVNCPMWPLARDYCYIIDSAPTDHCSMLVLCILCNVQLSGVRNALSLCQIPREPTSLYPADMMLSPHPNVSCRLPTHK